jgi:glycosyltransferase involved in cell wall biosynthesis
MKLIAVQGSYCVNAGISYTCLSLMDQMDSGTIREYWGLGFSRGATRSYTRSAMPYVALKAGWMLQVADENLRRALEWRVARLVRPRDVVWVWPPSSPAFVRAAQARKAFIVNERVNTSMRMYRRRVASAYEHLGWPIPFDWQENDEPIRHETEMILRSDIAFSPSPFARDSLLEIGLDESRILDSSYGWCPVRMSATTPGVQKATEKPRFLFVGTGSVRKGLPLLLRAWRDAAVDGELVIAGSIDQEVAERCAGLLALPSVSCLGHVSNIADVYRSCDVFVFPTHEEGSPQVTFEAAGCGLALLASPMGAAGVFRDQIDVMVLDPYRHDDWVEYIRLLAGDAELVRRMGSAAALRAQDFTWHEVARRRLAMLRRATGEADLEQAT